MTSEIEQGVAHQKAGRLAEAEDVYRRILAAEPEQPEALHWLGVLALQRGDPRAAATLIGRALKARPDYLQAHCNLGLALQAQGRLQEAVAAYERAKPALRYVRQGVTRGQCDWMSSCSESLSWRSQRPISRAAVLVLSASMRPKFSSDPSANQAVAPSTLCTMLP